MESAAQMVPVSGYASAALEECRKSAVFMTGPKCYIQLSNFFTLIYYPKDLYDGNFTSLFLISFHGKIVK
jgi:hypothetical protein